MAFGDGPDDRVLRQAWSDFCTQLERAGDSVFKDVNPPTALHRADGYRFLTQNLGQAFDLALETKDTRFPAFHRFVTPTRKLGSDCADAVYQQAWIDGESTYRVWGTKGSARFWNLAIQGHRPPTGTLHEPFGDTPEVNLLGKDLVTDVDGTFELIVGGPSREGNWLPTTPSSRKIFFRQFFDRWDESPSRVSIERLEPGPAPPPPDPTRMVEAMRWAGNFLVDAIGAWPEYLWRTPTLCDTDAINTFNATNLRRPLTDEDAKRGRFLTQMRWRLHDGEALIVEFEAGTYFWSATNEAVFGNSMDYRYRPVSYTPSRTAVDDDGRIRLILSNRDPGFANWIDTSGFDTGTLTMRIVDSVHVPTLSTSIAMLDALTDALPAGSHRISPAERQRALTERRRAVDRRSR